MLIRQMSCDSAFHGIPHQIAAAHRTKTECLGSVPEHVQRSLIRVGNSLFLARRRDISGGRCSNAAALGRYFLRLFGWQNLLDTDLINEVFAFSVDQMCPLFITGEMRPNPLRHHHHK